MDDFRKPFRALRPKPALKNPAHEPEPDVEQRSSLVNSAIYRDGKRIATPETLADTYSALAKAPDAMAWIGLYRPTPEEITSVAAEFGLHELSVEDAILAHQRPKIERYGDTLFVVLRAARYLDAKEEVEFGELHVFIGKNFVITVRHSESPDLSVVRHRLEETPEQLGTGTEA